MPLGRVCGRFDVSHFLVYVRRSNRPNGAPDVSDEAQIEAALAMIPRDATHEVVADSGGHHSGRTEARDGYQELIRRVEAGGIAGIAVYDLSRLARNARTMLNLKAALDKRNVAVLLSNMPTTRFDTATGKFMFGQLALAAELQANLDSERAVTLSRQLFEDGRHRGLPPRGYRNGKDATGRRTLEIGPEAPRVQQIVNMLPAYSFDQIASRLTADGYPMTDSAVKDVARRLRLYLGFVVKGRGLDERPGRHEPLITEAQYAAAIAGIGRRTRAGRNPRPFRVYVLSGLLYCGCGHRMRGEAKLARAKDWRYYFCPSCKGPRITAEVAETEVLSRLAELPPMSRRTIEQADREADARVTRPVAGLSETRRSQLERRLIALRKEHQWGDVGDTEYRQAVAETRYELSRLPDPDKLIAFTASRRLIESLAELIEAGGPAEHQRLVRATVERVDAADGGLVVTLNPAIADVFRLERPRTALSDGQPDSAARLLHGVPDRLKLPVY